MLKITLENGSAYEVLHETACYPSMSTTARSYLEIHMSADAMTLDEFYTLMTDSEATKKITLQWLMRRVNLSRKCTSLPRWNSSRSWSSSLPRWGCKGGMAYGNF